MQPMASTETQFGLKHDDLAQNASTGKDNWLGALYERWNALHDFQKFHGFTDAEEGNSNAFGTWLSDNCDATDFNKARRKWGVVGDMKNSVITREFKKDVYNFLNILGNMHNLTTTFRTAWN